MRRLALAATCLVAMAQAAPAFADVLYTNPPDLSSNQLGNCIYNTTCGPLAGANAFGAQLFTLAQTSTVTGAGFNAQVLTGGIFATAVNWIILDNDGAGGLPGTVLASGSSPLANAPGPVGAKFPTTDYSFTTPAMVLAAGDYYLAIQAVTTEFGDYLSRGVAGSGAAQSFDGGTTWTPKYQTFLSVPISITSTTEAIPEPATLALLGTGVLGLATARRRARQG